MNYKNYVWDNRENRAQQAKEHTLYMSTKYKSEIQSRVINSIIFGENSQEENATIFEYLPEKKNIQVFLDDIDTISAAIKYDSENKVHNIGILNFASYKNPGGRFIDGSKAQEECLCHESFLYNVLDNMPSYYDYNKKNNNNHLYTNRAIWTPGVKFEVKDSVYDFDVLTCAAPNFTAASRFKNITESENNPVLRNRLKFVLDIFHERNDIVILGAFGCGVFGQDPKIVARYFLDILQENNYNFSKVVFAIPKGIDFDNYNEFVKVFSSRK